MTCERFGELTFDHDDDCIYLTCTWDDDPESERCGFRKKLGRWPMVATVIAAEVEHRGNDWAFTVLKSYPNADD